jgi:transmembrane sensor
MRDDERQDGLSEAIGWHLRLRDNNPEDWDAFIHWLEGDPQRSIDYDTVALSVADLTPEAFPSGQPNLEPSVPFHGRWGFAAAAAAVIAIVGGVAVVETMPGSARYTIATGPGEQRKILIGDGSFAELNGSSRLVLDRENSRYADLVAGEATFTVRHDPARPFTVTVGEHKVQDVGTVFNIVRDDQRTRLDVLQGQVLFNPDKQRVPLVAGRTLVAFSGKGRILVTAKKVDTMAGWRTGQLSFADEPVQTVAGDLARSLGTAITVDRRLAGQPFTGSVRIEGDVTVQKLAATIGAKARRKGSGWLLEPS